MSRPQIRYQKEIVAIIGALHPRIKIYLFGSFARGDARAGSDIDLALDAGRPLTIAEIGMLKSLMEALPVSQRIDLVDIYYVPDDMKHTILTQGIVWKE